MNRYIRIMLRLMLPGFAFLISSGCKDPTVSPLDLEPLETLKDYNMTYKLDNHGRVMEMTLNKQAIDDNTLEALQKFTELRRLSFYAATITDDGLAKLTVLQQLESLGLGKTAISDKGLVHLKKLENLRWLWLTNCKVTTKRVEDLKTALPGLVVYR